MISTQPKRMSNNCGVTGARVCWLKGYSRRQNHTFKILSAANILITCGSNTLAKKRSRNNGTFFFPAVKQDGYVKQNV